MPCLLLSCKFLAILVGVIYSRPDYDQAGVMSISGAIFWMTLNMIYSNYTPILLVIADY